MMKSKKPSLPRPSALDALVAHLQFVLVLFVDLSQQLCFAAVQGLDEGVTLRH